MKIFKINYQISFIILLFLFFRFFIIIFNYENPNIFTSPDTASYYEIANYLSHLNFEFIIERTPIYPFFILICKFLFGNNPIFISIIQSFLSVIVLLMIFEITKHMHNYHAAYYASIFFLFDISYLFFSLQNLTEQLVSFWITLTIFLFFKFKKRNLIFLILISIIGALASLTKVMTQYFYFLIFLYIAIEIIRNKVSIKKNILKLIFCFLFYFSLLLPWYLHNFKTLGIITLNPNNFSYMMFYVKKINIENKVNQNNNKIIIAEKWTSEIPTLYSSQGEIINYEHNLPDDFDQMTYKEKNNFYFKSGINLIRNNPYLFLKDTIKRITYIVGNISDQSILRLLNIDRLKDNKFRYLDIISLVNNFKNFNFQFFFWLLNFIILLLSIFFFSIGTIYKIRDKSLFSLLILMTIIIFILFPALSGIGNARFRAPIIPLILVYSGIGLDILIIKLKKMIY